MYVKRTLYLVIKTSMPTVPFSSVTHNIERSGGWTGCGVCHISGGKRAKACYLQDTARIKTTCANDHR